MRATPEIRISAISHLSEPVGAMESGTRLIQVVQTRVEVPDDQDITLQRRRALVQVVKQRRLLHELGKIYTDHRHTAHIAGDNAVGVFGAGRNRYGASC